MVMNKNIERLTLINLLWIVVLSFLATTCDATSATEIQDHLGDRSNARPNCDIGVESLAKYGGTRTCIESPTFEGKRCFFTIIPDCAGPDSPLVFDAHGLASCPSKTAELTRWKEMAEEQCFVLVYPLGTTDPEVATLTCWGLPGGIKDEFGDEARSCCCSKRIRPVVTQDAAFFRQIAAVTSRDVPAQTLNRVTIDTKRIYLAGHSNGCMAAMSIAAQSSDVIAAIGCHSGSAITPFPESYNPTPMAFVHGTNDRVVPYKGNFLFHSAETTHYLISKANECTSLNETKTEDYLGSNNTVTEISSSGCKNNANVILYAVEGAGHAPYLGAETFRSDEVPTRFDSTELMWNFVKTYELDTVPSLVVRTTGQYPSLPSLDPFPEDISSDKQQDEQILDVASTAAQLDFVSHSIISVLAVAICHSIL